MPAPIFAQSAILLFERAPEVADLSRALSGFTIARTFDAEASAGWMGGHAGLLLAYRPEANGYALVDVVPAPWPDAMGDPKEDPMLFGAWSLGWFGPHAYPDNLARTLRQPNELPDAVAVVNRHRAFVRINLSYVLGAQKDAVIAPDDRDQLAELGFVTAVGAALLRVPGALAWFNPNGETIHDAASLNASLAFCREHDQPPLDVWTHVRLLNPGLPERWFIMDTIGMEQLGLVDHEACVPPGCELGQVVRFLRNVTNYVVTKRPVMHDGDTMDGPGGFRWRAFSFDESLAPRPRSVMRWHPLDGSEPPAAFGFRDRTG